MAGTIFSSFSDLVIIGERIEAGLKAGKIPSAMTISKMPTPNFLRKK